MPDKKTVQHGANVLPVKARRTIAVIDDEHKWLKVFQRMFRNSPYAVDTFDNPQQFVDTILDRPEKYAGIICDIKMPQMDGHQVFETVKGNPATRNIPFVIVSGVLTQDHNLSKVQGAIYISKLDDQLRSKIFHELIEVIENWPKVETYLKARNISQEKIEFFCQFFINYHKFFNEILTYVNHMEAACVNADHKAIASIGNACTRYMADLQETCMELISLMQESPETTTFVRKVCERGRTSLNMIQTFQLMLTDESSDNPAFRSFLTECRDNLEKIIIGTEKGYNLRLSG
jgi:CheY-like chemotaxis protein